MPDADNQKRIKKKKTKFAFCSNRDVITECRVNGNKPEGKKSGTFGDLTPKYDTEKRRKGTDTTKIEGSLASDYRTVVATTSRGSGQGKGEGIQQTVVETLIL